MVEPIAFSIEDIRNYAAKAGLGFQFIAKEAFLFELMELFPEKLFVLKGGTAINKGFLQGHQRFSEDLDYDTEMDRDELKEFVRSLGWKVRKEYFTRNSIGFALGYSFNGVEDSVKVDFSLGINGRSENRRVASDFLPVAKRVRMYTFPELNRQKEAALIGRREWKDLYDLYWMRKVNPKEFRIRRKKEFLAALEKLQVRKTANAYIPLGKRLNWEEVLERIREI